MNLQAILSEHVRWLETSGAEGKRADFTDADLRGADFAGADLTRANLIRANLIDADLEGTIGDGREIVTLIIHPHTVNICNDQVTIGCTTKSATEWLAQTDEQLQELSPDAVEFAKQWRSVIIGILIARGVLPARNVS